MHRTAAGRACRAAGRAARPGRHARCSGPADHRRGRLPRMRGVGTLHAGPARPSARLPRARFDAVVRMLGEGFSTRRGRRGALIHHDTVNHKLRARRGTRLTALTSGGAIPDTADYKVMLEPESLLVGSVNEDFAVESNIGDIFH